MSRARIAILGGTGFVGRSLCERLVMAGHEVRILTRHRERHRDLLVLPTAQVIEADVHTPAVLRREFQGLDAVVNLVGILNESGRDGKGFERAPAELPAKVVQAWRQLPQPLRRTAPAGSVCVPARLPQRTSAAGVCRGRCTGVRVGSGSASDLWPALQSVRAPGLQPGGNRNLAFPPARPQAPGPA